MVEGGERGSRKIFEDISKYCQNLMKIRNSQIQEAQWNSKKAHEENHTKAQHNQIAINQ